MKQKIKLIHSFSTKPLENKSMYYIDRLHHLISDIWIYTLSAAYARREGFDIELYTDSLGALLLSKAPYTKIHTDLDNISNDIHPRFWACGKVYALEAAGNNTIHIDGDVFIKDAKLLDVGKTDFIVQNEESSNYVEMGEANRIDKDFASFLQEYGIDTSISTPYNMGVIGIFNPALRDKYISAYKDLAIKISSKFQESLNKDNVTPDLFVEQLQFSQLSENYKGTVIIHKGAKEVPKGYQHLVTSAKYQDEIVNKVKQTLKVFFPEIYKKTLKLCRNI